MYQELPKLWMDVMHQITYRQLEYLTHTSHMEAGVVIHCRDMQQRTFDITRQYLPHNHKIHLHCFTGTVSDMEMWGE